jgi:hypothetical protein
LVKNSAAFVPFSVGMFLPFFLLFTPSIG